MSRCARDVFRAVPFLLAAASAASAHAAEPDAPTVLAAGSVLAREADIGETHRYVIDVRAGEYAQVTVEQQGADVVQTLTGPDGAVLLEADSPCGPIGIDPLAFIARASGTEPVGEESHAADGASRRGGAG